jgi:hypothetical protein
MYLLTIHLLQTQTRGWGHQVGGTNGQEHKRTSRDKQGWANKRGRAQTSGGWVWMSSDEWEHVRMTANMQGRARTSSDKCKWVGMSANKRRQVQTSGDKHKQGPGGLVSTNRETAAATMTVAPPFFHLASTNEGWEGEWAWMRGLGGLVSMNGEAAAAPAPPFLFLSLSEYELLQQQQQQIHIL